MKKKSSSVGVNRTLKASIRKYSPIFLLPTVIAFAIGFVWPFIWGVYLSFFRFNLIKDKSFVGFANYVGIFQDATFVHAFWVTALFAVISTIVINVIGFALAYALTSKVKGTTVFRTIFFMPNLIGGIVLAYVWQQLLNQIIHSLYTSGVLGDPQLVSNPVYGIVCLIILVAWQQIGYMMIIYIAGLQNVPNDFIEAAKMDGANGWQILGKIIIPTIMPSITICLFLSLTNGFKLFDQNFALTQGKPNHLTELLALNIYNSFYSSSSNRGFGQAKAVVFFVLVVVISLVQLAITKRKEVQQ